MYTLPVSFRQTDYKVHNCTTRCTYINKPLGDLLPGTENRVHVIIVTPSKVLCVEFSAEYCICCLTGKRCKKKGIETSKSEYIQQSGHSVFLGDRDDPWNGFRHD